MKGYPGLDGLDATGKVLVSAARTLRGYLGGLRADSPSSVVLATGAAASALFEGLIGPLSGDPPCPPVTELLVTPPNETRPVRIPVTYGLCDLTVHPVVSGTTGGAYTP